LFGTSKIRLGKRKEKGGGGVMDEEGELSNDVFPFSKNNKYIRKRKE
jgi:hypothetical protein